MAEDKLLKLLHEDHLITEEHYQQVIQKCEETKARVDVVLKELGILSEHELVEFLSKKFHMPIVDWDAYTVDQELLQLIPEQIAVRYTVFPYAIQRLKRGGKITLAVADPSDVSAIDDISFRTGCTVRPEVSSVRAIHHAIQRYYRGQEPAAELPEAEIQQEQLYLKEKIPPSGIEAFDSILREVSGLEEGVEEEADVLSSLDLEHPATKFLIDLLETAVRRGISGIHIDPFEQGQRVQFCLHGRFQQHTTIPDQVGRGVVERLRKLTRLPDPATLSKKEQIPWTGSFATSRIQGTFLTVRVHFYPTRYGEKIFLKIANTSSLIPLEHLGMGEKSLRILHREFSRPNGLLLCVSPPGHGKTTTIYSLIQRYHRDEANVLALGCPIEIVMPGVNQISVNTQMSYQDWYALISYSIPDLLIIENVDSPPIAQLAFELAGSTLVLASFNALDSAEGLCTFITWLLSATGKSWQEVVPLLLDVIVGTLSQRLIRILCPHCKQEVPVAEQTVELMQWLRAEDSEVGEFPVYTGKGCQECLETGYTGQTGIFEFIRLDKQGKQFLGQQQFISPFQLRQFFADIPIDTLKRQGLQKVRDGMTSPEEIRRVVTM